ncbi:MAG TPA: hypothetical protein VGN16_19675 [Acidobacteriaceae bacterium]|jgi:hypothetical protein
MNLTRRQQDNLRIAVWASVQGSLVKARQYRDNPILAAHEAQRQAEAAVAKSRANGKRSAR